MPSVYEHQLPNGLTLLFCRMPHLHAVHMSMFAKGGSLYENSQTQGVSHLLEHLCFRGVGELDHEALELLQCRFGTELRGATYPEGVVLQIHALPRFYNELLRLYHRVLECREWTQEEIAAEKQVVLRQIEEEESDFDDEVELKYRTSPAGAYPVMGTIESVENISAQTIRLWQRMIFQPNNTCICVAGPVTKGMEATAIAYFSDLANYTGQPPFVQTAPQNFCMRDETSDDVSVEQGSLASVHLAFDINAERVYPIADEVVNAITAGSADSLLFQIMREEKAMVAEIESYIEETGAYRRLVIRYNVRQAMLAESLRDTFRLLKRLCMYIRPVRMDLSRMQFTDNLAFYEDDPAGMVQLMGWAWMSGDLTRCDLQAEAALYNDLTVEDLQNAAQDIFRAENMTATIHYDPRECPDEIPALVLELRKSLA